MRTRRIGIDAIATPIRPPKANAIAERVVGTLRRECLDHLIILDEQHLLSVVREFVAYYNQDRPHRTLGLQTPEVKPSSVTGSIQSRPLLNGLHHVYERRLSPAEDLPSDNAMFRVVARRTAAAPTRILPQLTFGCYLEVSSRLSACLRAMA
ncbi:MAG: transposase [Chloroflexota bacterium]|nr:transposase [Chloroflexota bacterium]